MLASARDITRLAYTPGGKKSITLWSVHVFATYSMRGARTTQPYGEAAILLWLVVAFVKAFHAVKKNKYNPSNSTLLLNLPAFAGSYACFFTNSSRTIAISLALEEVVPVCSDNVM